MKLDFSILELYLILGTVYWYISLPIGLILGGLTIYAKNIGWGLPSVTLVGSLFFLIPLVWHGLFTVNQKLQQRERHQEQEAHTWVLEKHQTVAGIDLPADTKIYFNTWFEMERKKKATLDDIEIFELSAPTKIFGIIIKGRFQKSGYEWNGMLHGNQIIEGWPCTGEVILNSGKNLEECTLFKDHNAFGHTLSAGTEIELKPWSWSFRFPKGKIISFNPDNGELTFSSDSSAAFNFK